MKVFNNNVNRFCHTFFDCQMVFLALSMDAADLIRLAGAVPVAVAE